MAANTTPIFIKQGNFKPARMTGANTASDGSGTLFEIVTAGADGTRVDGVRFINSAGIGISSAKVFRIFLSDEAGTNFKIIGEIAAASVGRTGVAAGATSVYIFDQPLIMLPGQIMSVCQSVFGAFDQTDAFGLAGDY